MAYQIQYGKSKHEKKRTMAGRKWIPVAVLIALMIGFAMINGDHAVAQWLLPGDPAVTSAALGNLQQNLRAGEPVGEAIVAFCQEIIDGANLAQ